MAVAIDDAAAAGDMARVLGARGLVADPMPLERAMEHAAGELAAEVIAYAPSEPPTPELSARMAPFCLASAEAGSPVVMLCAFARAQGKSAWRRAASMAYLRAFGAIVCTDPDEWLETICLIAAYDLPSGDKVAIVTPDGSLACASAIALANEAELVGDRFPSIAQSPGRTELVDVALVERSALSPSTPDRVGQARIVPFISRAELLDHDTRLPLVGLRAALRAVSCAGNLSKRMDGGLGPERSGREDSTLLERLQPDLTRFERQLDKLDTRAGDHEAKVLLASWGIPVTRQAVATTPSAATRVAKKAGYPVEVKPWGPDQLSERDGCPVQRGLETAADVRRAMAQVAKAAGLPLNAPVIVRETPPPGRVVSAHVVRVGALGWMVGLEVPGLLDPVAAPAPLRPEDAALLSAAVEATRATDAGLDRDALADILWRVSHLAVFHEDTVEAIYLHSVVVSAEPEKTLVVDAQVVLVAHR